MKRLFNLVFSAIIGHLIKQKIREGSIKIVRAYVAVVKNIRLAALGVFALSAAAAVLVSGLVLVIVGLVSFLPMDASRMPWVILSIGAVLALVSGIGLALVFSQKRWLQMSKSYELMEVVLGPWPGMLPPNPAEILKGKGRLASDLVATAGERDVTVPRARSEEGREARAREAALSGSFT